MAYEALYQARVAKCEIEARLNSLLANFTDDTGLIVEGIDLEVIDTASIGHEINKLYRTNLDIRVLSDQSF